MKSKNLIIIIVCLLICICVLIAISVGGLIMYMASVNKQAITPVPPVSTGVPSNNENNKYKIVDKKETDETSAYTVDITYPAIENYSDKKVQDDFNQFVFDNVLKFTKEVKFTEPGDSKNTLEFNYKVEQQGDRFVSILMNGSVYTGGAHPNPVLFAINYDLKNNKEVKFSDLSSSGLAFTNAVSEITTKELQTKFGGDFIPEGAAANEDNFQIFTFNKEKLIITFNAYQVGPYAIGTPAVEIPLSKLSSYLKPEFK
jgi:hypothetical protein